MDSWQHAKDIFNQALDVQPTQRSAFLSKACNGDQTLLNRVRRLLDSDTAAGEFLEQPVKLDGDPIPIDHVPERIGPYHVCEVLGRGGMGVVYLAEQAEPVRRRVAVKLIKRGMDSEQVLGRFESEKQALAMMDHPNIARVLDAGVTADGRPYFAMEYVAGVAITEYCDRNRLTTAARIELMTHVCQAVQHAHQKGIIHRDIKPSNVLVTLHDGRPVPKVIDFGLARAIDHRALAHTLFTQLGELVGTPEYMSPEQAERTALDIDTRTDVYSLGVLLYELLTGSAPLDARSLRSGGFEAMCRKIREEDPPRPSTRLLTLETPEQRVSDSEQPSSIADVARHRGTDPRSLIRAVRDELDWITMKAMEKDRTRRYDTASGLAEDLRRYLERQPVLAAPPSALYRLNRLVCRHRAAVISISAIIVSLLAGLVGTTLGFRSALQQRDRAMHAEQLEIQERRRAEAGERAARDNESRAMQEAEKSAAVNQFLQDMLMAADPSHGIGRAATVRDALDAAAKKIAAGPLTRQPLVEAAVRSTIGRTYQSLGLYAPAETHLRAAVDLQEKHRGASHAETLAAMNDLAALYQQQGRFPVCEQFLKRVMDARVRLLGEDHADTLKTMNALGILRAQQGRFAESETLLKRVLAARRRVLGDEDPATLNTSNNLAGIYRTLGRFDEAEPLYLTTLDSLRRVRGPEHPDTLFTMGTLSGLYAMQGRFADAEPLMKQTLDARRRVLGDEHPDTLKALSNLAGLYSAQKRFAEAQPLIERTLEIRRRVLGGEHFETLGSMINLAQVYCEQGRHDEAETLWRDAMDALRRNGGERHPDMLEAMRSLAELYDKTNRRDEAEPLLLACHAALTGTEKYSARDVNAIRRRIARFYEAWGKPEKAAPWKTPVTASHPTATP